MAVKQAQNDILTAIHAAAADLHHAGVMPKTTLRKFDVLCLPPLRPMTAAHIKRIRQTAGVSQTVFAAWLNASPAAVRAWEQGDKKPAGPTVKLLNLVAQKGLEILA